MNKETLNKKIQEQDEKIKKDKEIIRQHEAQKKKLLAMEKEKERKERTRHLIELGGVILHFLELDDSVGGYHDKDEDGLYAFMKGQEDRGHYFTNFMKEWRSDQNQ